MEKTIKYLENGEYHYATVRDVGDLAKLKTDSKDDLVTAINELFITGGEAPKNPDGYDELVDNVADAIQKQQQMTDTITNMQQSAQLSDAEMEHMKQVQEELHQEYLKAIKELNEAVDKAKADAADLDKKTGDLQDKLDETFASVDKEVSDVHKQLDSESAGLRKDLDDTKTSLESTRKDLLNNTQEFGVVNSEVKELKDKMDRRIWSTDLDPVREQVNKNTTEVSQTKDELKNKADQSSLDLVTNSVENLSTQVKENADGLKVSVKKDELGGDVARLLNDKTNLLLGTRSFSGEDNWKNRDTVTIEPGYYKGLKSAAVQVLDASIYQPYRVKANTAYTFSFFGKEDRDNPKATLVIKPIDAQNVNVDGGEQQVHITTEWQRFAVTFSVDQECEISIQIIQGPEATNNILHLAGLKLQYGQNDTPWEPNEADIAENIEHNESQFNVYSDQIAGIVKKQEKMGDTERQLDTRITETAEGLKQTSKDLQDANGKITEFKGQLESTARGLKTEYEKYTNEAIGQISDSSLNLIHNSAFSNQDDQFESWQNISAKATVREDSNNLHWVELTQSGQGTDNPIGVTSNYFIVKQGKVTVAVDVKLGDKANLDNQNILLLELYDENKKRVDFTDVSVSQLGLSMSVLNDHNVHRGLYRPGIDRKDVKYMTVKAILHRNGDLWLTNFSARLSSIDDGGYTPNPDDVNHQILKMNTKIEEDAEHIALKANSVDVTRDIKSAVDGIQVGGVNLAKNTGKPFIMGYCIPNTTWKDNSAYLKLPTTVTGGEILPQDDNFTFYLLLEKGKTYTQTIWVETDANVKDLNALQFTWFTSDGHDFQPARVKKIGDKLYKLYSTYTWPGKKDNSVRLFDTAWLGNVFNLTSSGSYLKFLHPQIEYGNQSTDWSQSPEDISTEIKSAKDAAIKVASDQINIHVNDLSTQFDDKLNKRVNEVKTASEKFTSDGIEQTVSKITEVKNNVDNLNKKVDSNNGGGINLQKGTKDFSFQIGTNGNPSSIETYNSDTKMLHIQNGGFYTSYSDSSFVPTPGEFYTFSADVKGDGVINGSGFRYEGGNNGTMGNITLSDTWQRIINTVHVDKVQGQWVIYPSNSKNLYVKHIKIERGTVATPWTAAPEDVESTHTLDTANIDEMKTQGHYFVKNLTGNPIGGWVYVDVTGNNNDRVRQDVYQDTGGKHMSRRLFGNSWSGWEQGAYLSDVNNTKTEVTASVKNLGDRVTTEVNSITKRVNSINGGGVNLLRGTADFRPDNIWFPLGLWTRTNEAYNGLTIFKDHEDNDWYGLTQYYSVKAGETYTFSLNARYESGSGSSTLFIMLNGDPENGHKAARVSPVTRDITLNEDWQRYSFTFTVNSDGYIKPRIERTSNNKNVLEICGFKLERGPVATPWTPAPEDTADQIKQLNTKWEVANGQIQGKVTETDVNNILNGKGYVTQSWAQTMFQMKSDSITLQTVRDNITNGIQNQVNGINKKIDTQILDSANIDQMKTQGHYFVKNLTGNPIGGWVYVDVNCADQWRIRQDVYQDIGGSHVYRRLNGSSWTEWTTDVNNKNIISQINITPDQIKIASNKIVLDGDTEIKGTAFIPSAAIKDITADKITTGTLSGITIRAGDEDGFFQTSEDNIYWITNSGGSAVIGKGKYVQYPGLNVFDNNAVYLGSWAGAELNKDGTINDYGGAIGNPKLAIETGGMRRRFNVDSWGGEFEDKPLDNNRIISWVGNKEFLSVERENGTHIELNPDINGSQFTVQKDDKFGAYFGQGRDGNEINFTPIGGMTINGNFRVTGAKNAIVKTSQGTVAINAYETAGYFFGDIGSAKTSDNKVAMIDIESLFKETVNTDVEYQVFLTSYGPGDIWVSERQRDYFVVESELPNMEFGWEIKAKRKGYENTRLAKVDVSNVPTV